MAPPAGAAARPPGARPAAKTLAPCADPVPEGVLVDLRAAYGEDLGRVGSATRGHGADSCLCQRTNVLGACGGACLVYGELLPGGCARALRRLGLAGAGEDTCRGTLLELGMGTGKVALQAFLQCPSLSRVIGVELSRPRFALAAEALRRLAAARQGELRLEEEPEEPPAQADDQATCTVPSSHAIRRCLLTVPGGGAAPERTLELRRGDFLQEEVVGDAEFQGADVVLLQLCLPQDALKRVQERLRLAPQGCRLFVLSDFRAKWRLPRPSHFYPWRRGDEPGQDEEICEDHYATTWASTYGMTFYTFRADWQRWELRHGSGTHESMRRIAGADQR